MIEAGALELLDPAARAWSNRALGAILSVQALANLSDEKVWSECQRRTLGDSGPPPRLKDLELATFMAQPEELGEDVADGDFYALQVLAAVLDGYDGARQDEAQDAKTGLAMRRVGASRCCGLRNASAACEGARARPSRPSQPSRGACKDCV